MTTRSNLISARVLNGGALYAHIQDKTNPHEVAVDGVTIGGGGTLADPFAVINDVFLETVSVDGTTIIGSGTALDPLKIYNAADGKSYVNIDGAWVELKTDLLAYDFTAQTQQIIDFSALDPAFVYEVIFKGRKDAGAANMNLNIIGTFIDSTGTEITAASYSWCSSSYKPNNASLGYSSGSNTSLMYLTGNTQTSEQGDLTLKLEVNGVALADSFPSISFDRFGLLS